MSTLVDQFGRPMLPSSPTTRVTAPFGIGHFFNQSQRVFNPDNLTFSTYERMVDTDETVGSALEFIGLTVNAYIGEYEYGSRRIQKFVRDNLVAMRTPLPQVNMEGLSCLWVGHSDTEVVLWEKEGRLWIDDLPCIHPENINYELETEGRNKGQIKAIHQYGVTDPIDAAKVMHLTHRSRFGNPYGVSRLKAIWGPWFIKNALRIAWPQTLERYGGPIAIGKTQNPSQVEKNGKRHDENLLAALQGLQNNASMVLPLGDEVDFLQISRSFGNDFERAENHFNRMIFRGLLMPSLVFENGDIGSFAMAKKHFEVFLRGIFNLVHELTTALIQQVIRPLIIFNFGHRNDYGSFARQTLEEEDLEIWSKIFYSMAQIGALKPEDQADFDWMRDKFGAPRGLEPREYDPDRSRDAGKDGIPGAAPDGQDGSGPGVPSGGGGGAPGQPQGRPEEDDDEE